MNKDLKFTAKHAEISGNDYKTVKIEVDTANVSEVLDNFTPSDIVEHFGLEKLLEDVEPADILNQFEHGQFIEHISPEKIAESMGASFVAGVFETAQLLEHMNADDVFNYMGIDRAKEYFNLKDAD